MPGFLPKTEGTSHLLILGMGEAPKLSRNEKPNFRKYTQLGPKGKSHGFLLSPTELRKWRYLPREDKSPIL